MKQWLPEWDKVNFDEGQNQSRPGPHFYLFSMSAAQLRKLSAIYRRDTDSMTPRKDDLGIQRRHDKERSAEIRRYVAEGFPRSGLSDVQRKDPSNEGLRKPGWLPTAVVVNILETGDERNGRKIDADHAVRVQDSSDGSFSLLTLPEAIDEALPPIEVIDGQHRLFAFDDDDPNVADFELPVVAFHGLDISWQAYLFWTINIKPKKINASLAFDLYPLLREQDWLDSGDRILVYRESRAQELTEVLWATPESPWFKRINMLGGPRKENGPVTQAAFVRSLIASMVKPWEPSGRNRVGGIFGGTPNQNDGLAWSRLQQGAFLVTAWRLLAEAVQQSDCAWAAELRIQRAELEPADGDPAFSGGFSLLATDQGVRGFQSVVNDLCYIRQTKLGLTDWRDSGDLADVSAENVREVASTLPEPIHAFLKEIAAGLSTYDWRTSSFPNLPEQERLAKAALRGSGGYKELRDQLLAHLRKHGGEAVISAADELAGWA
ncbi:DGQHR domain-containing protein [Microbacterium betulae]|uniref:DGQHR domain-containing protein n=1 Tax=Microbacterium betulae TaxID=2981139 RepID=A0AA97FF73_9MICO|nr:DGQHR domain-containing protein [Microbacterium sp. AB]WOF21910.1 DGQHR domain-containing protein [Microbacterium sp. AB]